MSLDVTTINEAKTSIASRVRIQTGAGPYEQRQVPVMWSEGEVGTLLCGASQAFIDPDVPSGE
jgi:hypothetical protein